MSPIKDEGQISFDTKKIDDDGIERQVFENLMAMKKNGNAHRSYTSADRAYKKLLGLDSLEEPTEYLVAGKGGSFVVRFLPKPTEAQTELRPAGTRLDSSITFTAS